MASRITKEDVRKAFGDAFGGDVATAPGQVGKYILEYAPDYGGWRISQYANEDSGERMPFGEERYSSRRMLDFLTGYATANYLARRKGGAGPRERAPFSNCVNAGPSRNRRRY